MLPPDRVRQIFTLSTAGMPVRAIARQLGHSPQTVRAYLHQRRTPGVRAVSCARSFKMRMTASFMVRMCGCEEGPADGSRRGLGVRGGAVVVSLP